MQWKQSDAFLKLGYIKSMTSFVWIWSGRNRDLETCQILNSDMKIACKRQIKGGNLGLVGSSWNNSPELLGPGSEGASRATGLTSEQRPSGVSLLKPISKTLWEHIHHCKHEALLHGLICKDSTSVSLYWTNRLRTDFWPLCSDSSTL